MTQFNDPRVFRVNASGQTFRVNPDGQAFQGAPEGQRASGQEWSEEPAFRPMPTEADVPPEVLDLDSGRYATAPNTWGS